MASKQGREQITELRAEGLAKGWTISQIVEAICAGFAVSRLGAHRLARGWTRAKAVENIFATCDADGWPRPSLTTQRLCAWERDPRVRPGQDYLDRLCRVYETRPDLLGYGHDYTPIAELAPGAAGDESAGAYAGALEQRTPARCVQGRVADAVGPENKENATNRNQFLHGTGRDRSERAVGSWQQGRGAAVGQAGGVQPRPGDT